jgi:hypothetical protein
LSAEELPAQRRLGRGRPGGLAGRRPLPRRTDERAAPRSVIYLDFSAVVELVHHTFAECLGFTVTAPATGAQ